MFWIGVIVGYLMYEILN